MIKASRWTVVKVMIVFGVLCTGAARVGGWTDSVEVRHELKRCVTYRARLTSQFLVIQATHEAGWRTYAMDNKQRAQEKLTGRRSLGIERSTEVGLTEGLEVAGPWYQSPPKDFSKPELRWFTWGFEGQVLFVAKVRRLGAGPARIVVRGQACTEATCKNIDVAISIPFNDTNTEANNSDIDFEALIQVR